MTAHDDLIDAALTAAAASITAAHRLIDLVQAVRAGGDPAETAPPRDLTVVGWQGLGDERTFTPPPVIDADIVVGGPIQTALTGRRRVIGEGIGAGPDQDLGGGGDTDGDRPPVAKIPDVSQEPACRWAHGESSDLDARGLCPVCAADDDVPGPAIEGAMPPNHCRNHRDHRDDCKNCETAQEAQDRWRSEFDEKTRAAREQVEAELAADDVHLPPGRTAFRIAKATLDARVTAKTTDGKTVTITPMATTEQLTAIATAFGKAGVTVRDQRLTLLSETIGRQLTTSAELTRAEASYVLDRLTGPPPPVDPPGDERSKAGPMGTGDGTLVPAAEQRESAAEAADDGTEPEPEGDPDVEREYLRDRDSWGDDLQLTLTRSTDDPPY
jgi:hypothetical protein